MTDPQPRDAAALMVPEITTIITEIERSTTLLLNSAGFQRGVGKPTAGTKNIQKEAGYPETLSAKTFWEAYQREGWQARVVNIMPEETWQIQPEIYETEDVDVLTEWEQAWKVLVKTHRLWSELFNLDVLAGIGRFALMVFGYDDGKKLSEPIEVVYDKNLKRHRPAGNVKRDVTWIHTYAEHQIEIIECDTDETSPRFGWPTRYRITIDAPTTANVSSVAQIEVHWTRAYHYADNRLTSKVFGLPRMLSAWNRLYDLLKIAAGSPEGYWQSCNPILSVTSQNPLPQTFDTAQLKEQIWRLQSSLQKYLAVAGMEAKLLSPSMVDPTQHSDLQLTLVCLGIGVPKRVFMGTEEGKLAGDQDKSAFGARKKKRRETETGPVLIIGCAEYLMMTGALPFVEELHTAWPEHNEESANDKATAAKNWTDTLVKYAESAEARMVMPEVEYFSRVWGLDADEIDELTNAMDEAIGDTSPDSAEDQTPPDQVQEDPAED